jgi:uncharacterized protein (TIGR01777 family)
VDALAFEGVTKVVNLAGASIGGKGWTNAYKREILDSRVQAARLLFQQISKSPGSVSGVVSASAIGFYGSGPATRVFSEDQPAGSGFLAEVVSKWENEVARISELGVSVSMVRTGVVLSGSGGALPRMATPIRFGVGAPLGSGEQMISWVHIDDLCGIYLHLLTSNLAGVFNASAPHPVTNEMLTKAIAGQLGRPLWLPHIPPLVLKIVLGELAEAVLTGSNVSSQKIEASGYRFLFPDVETALKDLL